MADRDARSGFALHLLSTRGHPAGNYDTPAQAQQPRWLAPAAAGTTPRDLVRHAARRVVVRLSAGAATRVVGLPAVSLQSGPRAKARDWLASGAVLLPASVPFPPPGSVLADIAEHSGTELDSTSLRLGSDGTLVAMGRKGGTAVVLRAFPPARLRQHQRTLATLEHLRAAGTPLVPRLLDHGFVGAVAWLLESRLAGARPRRLSASLVDQVLHFCLEVPPSRTSPRPIADRLPPSLDSALAARLRALGDAAAAIWSGVEPVGTHGDLWLGNILTDGDRLTGVVDWDAYRTDVVPGTDLVHLVSTADRLQHHRSMGAELLTKPWQRAPLRTAGRCYFDALGLHVDEERWAATAVTWWLGQLCDTLSRSPELAADERWLQANVTQVVDALG